MSQEESVRITTYMLRKNGPMPIWLRLQFVLCPIHGSLRENDVLNFSMAGFGWGGNFRSTNDTLPKLSRIKSPCTVKSYCSAARQAEAKRGPSTARAFQGRL